jgi:outer membrane receptor for ferrienterochelin and colicin
MKKLFSISCYSFVFRVVFAQKTQDIKDTSPVNLGAVNLCDIERTGVLDGGASVQYGNSAQAGLINIITKKSGAAKTNIATGKDGQ